MLLGAALFSVAAGFCIFPSIKKEVLKRINATGGEANEEKGKESLRSLRRLYASKRIRAMQGGLRLSGWLFTHAAAEGSINRILVIAPEGRAVSIEDLCSFLRRGFLDRAGCRDGLPAVFIPKPSEHCNKGIFFSFGKKEAKALVSCARYLSIKFPQSSLLFCGKGLGAFSAIFAAHKLALRANFAGVVADLPSPSIAAIMRDVAAKLFPQRALRLLVYLGARLAFLFCGLGIGGRSARHPLKKLSSIKKERAELVVAATTKS